MENIGGYDINSFRDNKGVRFLTDYLEKHKNIKGIIASDDKIPNLDGTIQLLESIEKIGKAIPIRIFNVQVKTLDSSYTNRNKKKHLSEYKYSVDTKVFNVVKRHITSDPVLLFLVDIKNKKIFWFNVTVEMVLKLGITDEKDKTIYFNDENQIIDFDLFYNQLLEIHKNIIYKEKNPMENIIITDAAEGSALYQKLYDEWEYLDNLLCNKLKIMTKLVFPDVWKFGIAFANLDNEYNTLGIYKIINKGNNNFVKDFFLEEDDCFTISIYNKERTDIRQVLNNQVSKMIGQFYKQKNLPASCLSDIVLEEVTFDFLDRMASVYTFIEHKKFPTIYYKNTESVNEIKRIWNALILYEIRCTESILKSCENENNIEIQADPIEELKHNKLYEEKDKLKLFSDALKDDGKDILPLQYPLTFKKNQKYELYFEVLCELEKRYIKEIHRPWIHKKYKQMFEERRKLNLQGYTVVDTGYLLEDSYSNFQNILKNLPDAYNFARKKLWGNDYEDRCLKEEITISIDKNDCLFEYTKITRYNYSYNIIVNNAPEIQIDSKVAERLKSIHAQKIEQGRFDHFIKLDLPLYSEIWYLINKEMWNKCDSEIQLPIALETI